MHVGTLEHCVRSGCRRVLCSDCEVEGPVQGKPPMGVCPRRGCDGRIIKSCHRLGWMDCGAWLCTHMECKPPPGKCPRHGCPGRTMNACNGIWATPRTDCGAWVCMIDECGATRACVCSDAQPPNPEWVECTAIRPCVCAWAQPIPH